MSKTKFPFEIEKAVEVEKFAKYYKGNSDGHILVGPKKYVLEKAFEKVADDFYNMPLRSDDIFVVSFPRSGTTWTQELVWLINNDMDFKKAKSVPLTERFPFLEYYMFSTEEIRKSVATEPNEKMKQALLAITIPATEILAKTPSPRFIKSHLPISLLPAQILDTAKIVYVARHPGDMMVSYYHFQLGNRYNLYEGDFKAFFDQIISGCNTYTPYLEHVKEAWELQDHPNVLFIFYEDLIKDMAGSLRRVAEFFGKQYTEEQFAALADHLHIDNFKKNAAVDLQVLREAGIFNGEFVRKEAGINGLAWAHTSGIPILNSESEEDNAIGKSNGWTEYMDEEMQARMAKWLEEGLRGSTLRFPE